MEHPEQKRLRELVASAVRAALSAAGRGDMRFEDDWIGTERMEDGSWSPTASIRLAATGYSLPLTATPAEGEGDPAWTAFAGAVAETLPLLATVERTIARRLRAVRRTTYDLLGHTGTMAMPAPIEAARLVGLDRRRLLDLVRYRTPVGRLDEELRWEVLHVDVAKAADVEAAVGPLLIEERDRTRRLLASRAPGPHLLVDEVTLALISAGGFDPVATLREFMRRPDITLHVHWNGTEQMLPLSTRNRRVETTFVFQKGKRQVFWSAGLVWIQGARSLVRTALAGGPIDRIADHPAVRGRRIEEIEPDARDPASCSIRLEQRTLRFDGLTGLLSGDLELPDPV